MTKLLDLRPTALTLSTASRPDLDSVRRLLVLVPGQDADLALLASRVWELADATGAHVWFVGLYNDPAHEPGVRRSLITLSAMVNLGSVSAEAEIMAGIDWVEAVRSRWKAGDLVVCAAEQRVGLTRRPMSQILQSGLDVPLYILTGLYPQNNERPHWLAQAAAWTGSLAILFGFFVLQAWLGESVKVWTTVLQLLSILFEAWSIWAWNRLFG